MRPSSHRFAWPVVLGLVAALGGVSLWFAEPRVALLWLNTACLAAGAALVALPLGTLAALLIYKTDVPGRNLAAVLFVGMLFVPLYLVAGAWDAGFGLQGWHTLRSAGSGEVAAEPNEPWLVGWRAAIWIHGMAAVPWVVLIVGAGLRTIEAEIEEDAATCTAPLRVLWHVSLPRATPAILMAGLWIAIVCTAEISVTDFFQVRTFAEEVYTQAALGTFDARAPLEAAELGPSVFSAAGLLLGILLSAVVALLAMVAAGRLITDWIDAPQRAAWIWRLGRRRWIAVTLLSGLVLLVAGLPLANLLNKAGMIATITPDGPLREWSLLKAAQMIAAAPLEFSDDLILSTLLGLAATSAAIVVALPMAWSMRKRRHAWIWLGLLAFCLTVPGPLIGVSMIRVLNQPAQSPLAMLGWLYDTNFAPWLVQTIRVLPLVTLVLWPALASVPQIMLDSAATEGSGWWGQLLRIAVPQRWPALAAAWCVGLAIAVGELAATILVVPPQPATPIAVRVFQLLHYGVDDRVAAISLMMIATVAVLTAFATAIVKRKS